MIGEHQPICSCCHGNPRDPIGQAMTPIGGGCGPDTSSLLFKSLLEYEDRSL